MNISFYQLKILLGSVNFKKLLVKYFLDFFCQQYQINAFYSAGVEPHQCYDQYLKTSDLR